jgi:hypothetical protein
LDVGEIGVRDVSVVTAGALKPLAQVQALPRLLRLHPDMVR